MYYVTSNKTQILLEYIVKHTKIGIRSYKIYEWNIQEKQLCIQRK